MSSFLFFNACSIKNPLNNKSKYSYIDCPQTLILAPASKISNDQVTMTLNKGYSVNCYLPEPDSTEVVIEYNYSIETLYKIPNSKTEKIEFIVFITNKKEDIKIYEESFFKDIAINISEDEMPELYKEVSNFNDKIIIAKNLYENGIKSFIAIN
ncbi:MAG: hypothetical protein ACO3RR_05255 [Alphaproteobacteria bacterium]